MTGARRILRKSLSRLIVVAVLAGGFCVGVALIPQVLARFSHVLPENYRYVARRAIERGDFATAEELARRRIGKHFYDFDAHYLQAEALARWGRPDEAATVMKQTLAKFPSARSKKDAIGYDEPRTLGLLAQYLWAAGAWIEAGEMSRAALDAGAPALRRELGRHLDPISTQPDAARAVAGLALRLHEISPFRRATDVLDRASDVHRLESILLQSLWFETVELSRPAAENLLRNAVETWPGQPASHLAIAGLLHRMGQHDAGTSFILTAMKIPGTRTAGPGLFELPVGGVATTNSISLSRNGTARARFDTGVYRLTSLCFCAHGTPALGMYPILIIREGDKEMARVYIDGPQPHLYDLALWPGGAPKSLDLRFEFVNDVWDPFTKADRNITISDIILH